MTKEDTSPPTQLFFKDRLIMAFVILGGLVSLLNVASVILRLRSHTFKVPVQYNVSDGSILQTDWYYLYGFVIFSLFGLVASVIVAHRLYTGSRWFALGTLLLYLIVAVSSFITINALLGFVSQI
jgi:hypothetical protein